MGLVKHLEDWVWLCTHVQDEKYLKKAKANAIYRSKKKLLHQSGFRRFSYRIEERRQARSKFLAIDTFNEVYVQHRDELMEQLHATMVEKRHAILEEVASQLSPNQGGAPLGCGVLYHDGHPRPETRS